MASSPESERIRLGTEREMHNAWRKRAEEAEKKLEDIKHVECSLRLFSASSALGLSEQNSILSASDKLREIMEGVVTDVVLAYKPKPKTKAAKRRIRTSPPTPPSSFETAHE